MKRALIKPYGFMGDCLFATSAARKLKEEGQFDEVDLATGFLQIQDLLVDDPWIDNILALSAPTTTPLFGRRVGGYDAEFETRPTILTIPPPMQAQLDCGVREPDTKFEFSLSKTLTKLVKEKYQRPYIAYMNVGSWMEKAYDFTRADYIRGKDVPYLGYGGSLRDIPNILDELRDAKFNLVEVGLKKKFSSLEVGHKSQHRTISWDAAIIAEAEFFIGAEGGLANIAAAVHTTTILTADYVHQLYGWNGVMKQIENPQLGPRFYWPEDGHIDLNPYLTDEQVIREMTLVLSGRKTASDFTYEWVMRP